MNSKKLRIQIVRVTLILSVLFLMYNAFTKLEPKEVTLKDYMPKKPMVKIFSGGFENSGYAEVIDKIKGDYYQKKTFDSGTTGVTVYRVTKDNYKIVYRDGEVGELKDNYLNEKENLDLVLLREPLKEGVSWINSDNSTYKILSTEETFMLEGKEISAVKLRYRKDGYEYYIYVGKGLGIIGVDTEMGNSRIEKIDYNVKDYLKKHN